MGTQKLKVVSDSDIAHLQSLMGVVPDGRVVPRADNSPEMSCAQVGRELRLSSNRVHQIEREALAKLRRILEREGLQAALRELLRN